MALGVLGTLPVWQGGRLCYSAHCLAICIARSLDTLGLCWIVQSILYSHSKARCPFTDAPRFNKDDADVSLISLARFADCSSPLPTFPRRARRGVRPSPTKCLACRRSVLRPSDTAFVHKARAPHQPQPLIMTTASRTHAAQRCP